MKTKLLLLIVILNLAFSPLSFAAENQFNIDLAVTGTPDVTPPTAPTALAATAVSTSQINLSWTASTDNVLVSAYKVYRDGSFIATSTVTNYSNNGLSASTLYSYVVRAVDSSGNESVDSNIASATTLSGTTPGSGGGGNGGGSYILSIYDLLVVPSEKSVKITWKTYTPTISTLSWGLTSEYKDEVIRESSYTTTHEMFLTDLSPATVYYFKIESENQDGIVKTLENQSFKTSGLPEGIPNAINFKAVGDTNNINLSWTNPTDPNFSEVRILRSPNFFPSDYLDGEVVYQGRGESFVDTKIEIGKNYYYTLFVKDKFGNYSSGIVSNAKAGTVLNPAEPIPDVFDSLPKAPNVHPAIEALNFWDFDFIQGGKKINPEKISEINIDGNQNLTISIGYGKIPEVLKSIIVTLRHPSDPKKVFSFILKVNKDKTLYTATIAPLGESGKYATRIAIVDYKNRGMKATDGTVSVQLALTQGAGNDSGNRGFWLILALLALAFTARRIEKYLKEKKQKELKVPRDEKQTVKI